MPLWHQQTFSLHHPERNNTPSHLTEDAYTCRMS